MEAAAPPQTAPIFPHDISLEDARAAISGRFEFKEKQEGDLVRDLRSPSLALR